MISHDGTGAVARAPGEPPLRGGALLRPSRTGGGRMHPQRERGGVELAATCLSCQECEQNGGKHHGLGLALRWRRWKIAGNVMIS